MTDKDTDNDTEQPSRDELETRVEQLEQTVQQMLPSRRDALKLGGTALAAGALGSAATGSASAGTNSVGQIGTASNPVDAELEDINPGSVRAVNYNNNEITNVSSLSTESLLINNEFALNRTKQTISNNSISSPTSPLVNLEGENTSNDDLDDIGGVSTNAIIILQATAQDITVRDNKGNIRLDGDANFTLTSGLNRLMLQYDNPAGIWVELTRTTT